MRGGDFGGFTPCSAAILMGVFSNLQYSVQRIQPSPNEDEDDVDDEVDDDESILLLKS